MYVSIVIPCYRPSNSLKLLVEQLCIKFDGLGLDYEILLVQDSADRPTTRILHDLCTSHEQVRLVALSRNFGQQAATIAGISASSGELVVTLDDDFQHRPEDVLRMLNVLEGNDSVDLVYGRSTVPSHSRIRSWASEVFRRILKLSGLRFANSLSPFRAFRGSFREVFRNVPGPGTSVDVCLGWVVNEVEVVDCEFNPRKEGKSTYSRRKLFRLALQILIMHTTAPLTIGVIMGLSGLGVALIYGSTLLVSYFATGTTPPGFATITLLIVSLSSVQIILIGILGLYLGRLYAMTTGQPTYFAKVHPNSPSDDVQVKLN